MKNFFVLVCAILFIHSSFSQKAPLNWYLKHPQKDKVFGVGATEAYKLLVNRIPKEVIVAVIDSGVETDHPDLKDVIWINSDEIPANGIDDDKNGYVDDVNGWSFLGGQGGDINNEAMEIARMFQKENRYFDGKDASTIDEGDKARYEKFLEIKNDFNREQGVLLAQYKGIEFASKYIANVKKQQGEFSKKANKKYTTKDAIELKLQKNLKRAFLFISPSIIEKQVEGGESQIGGMIRSNTMNADSLRQVIVGDNINSMSERYMDVIDMKDQMPCMVLMCQELLQLPMVIT